MTSNQSAAQVQASFEQALALHQRGQLAQAQRLYENVLESHPDHFDSLHLLGVIAYQSNRPQEAVELIARAIEINPGIPTSYSNIGAALEALGLLDEAVACYDKAISLNPDYAEAYYNRGNSLKLLRRLDEAVSSYERAIALKPDYAEACNNRGNALIELKQPEAAVASFLQALATNPGYADAFNNLGNALKELKRLDDALACYSKALALRPDYEFLAGTVLSTRMMLCDWQGFSESLAGLEAGIQESRKVVMPFPVLALVDSPALHLQAARIYAATKHPQGDSLGPMEKHGRAEKIRIGYFSADFHNHATAYLMAELFEAHDRSRFEWIGFSFGPEKHDEMRQRVSSAFDRFIDVRNLSDREVAAEARALGIDIAVDLKGFTQDSRPGIFAEGCAPIQADYLGYPGTMGADYIDYVIADATVIPPERRTDYTEKVVYLPHCYQVNDSRRRISERIYTRQEMGLPESGFVFCCFNNNYKIVPSTFDGWMRILKAVEHSVLWLFEDNPTAAANLRKEAEARGIDRARLVFAKRMPLDEHLARHRLADLFIDTLPYNAHTTASDALWAGLPVLTCAGTSFAARVAASLLKAVGLPELVAATQQEYERMAIELAADSARLSAIRQKLQGNRLKAPLFDARLFATHVEAAYQAMYDRYQAGLPPAHIEIH